MADGVVLKILCAEAVGNMAGAAVGTTVEKAAKGSSVEVRLLFWSNTVGGSPAVEDIIISNNNSIIINSLIIITIIILKILRKKSKGRVFNCQEPPSGESTTCSNYQLLNYQLLSVIY